MGNRATVIFTDGKKAFSPAVYLHWNGGAESVYAFLEELNRRKVRADQDCECARFIQLVGEFLDSDGNISGTSLGVVNSPKSDTVPELLRVKTDHGNNGFYLVNRTGARMTVRRFTEKYIGDGKDYGIENFTLVELPPKQVAQEKADADSHKYRTAIREFYAELTKGKKVIDHSAFC